jgi:hypothetical protein
MNRRALEQHLRRHGCRLHHHGAKHDMWVNPATNAHALVPRHKSIKRFTARGICRKLGVRLPPEL